MSIQIAVSAMTNDKSFLEEGVETAMRKLAERGAKSLEISQHIQFNENTWEEFEKAGKKYDIGFCAISTRFYGTIKEFPNFSGLNKMRSYSAEEEFDLLVSLCKRFHCQNVRFLGLPGRQMTDLKAVKEYMASVEEMAIRFEKEGIHFCAHNHADEYLKVEGKTIFEWSLELAPHLCYELDVLNCQKAGLNPCKILKRCGSRAVLLHVQDQKIKPPVSGEISVFGPELYQGCAVGDGLLDYPEIVKTAKEIGSQYLIIEQGKFYGEDPYDSIGKSVSCLKQLIEQE